MIRWCIICGKQFTTNPRGYGNRQLTCSPEHSYKRRLQMGNAYNKAHPELSKKWKMANAEKKRISDTLYREKNIEIIRRKGRDRARKIRLLLDETIGRKNINALLANL